MENESLENFDQNILIKENVVEAYRCRLLKIIIDDN